MNCPKCQLEMEAGFANISSTGIGSAFSRANLWFKPLDKKVEMALMSTVERSGFRCIPCGIIVIEGGAGRAVPGK